MTKEHTRFILPGNSSIVQLFCTCQMVCICVSVCTLILSKAISQLWLVIRSNNLLFSTFLMLTFNFSYMFPFRKKKVMTYMFSLVSSSAQLKSGRVNACVCPSNDQGLWGEGWMVAHLWWGGLNSSIADRFTSKGTVCTCLTEFSVVYSDPECWDNSPLLASQISNLSVLRAGGMQPSR